MQEQGIEMDEELKGVFDNFDDLYGNIKSKSLEDQIAIGRSNIYELRKDLQGKGDNYSAEDYEISDAIDIMEVVVEDLQAQLKKKLQEKLENGELTEGDIESMVKNPYREENFEIEKSISGSFLVRSDSERFGERAIVYEDTNRNNCVNYIEERQPAKEPTYYVIENLHEFTLGKNKNITWGTLEECLEKYKGYVESVGLEKNAYKDKVTCTLGVATNKNDMDLIHCINGISYAGTGIVKNKEHNTNKHILNDLGATVEVLDIKQAVIFGEGSIDYTSLSQLDGKEVFENGSKERKEQLQDKSINGVRLPKTGYNGAPEVTQELFDKIVQTSTKDLDFSGCYFSEVTISGKFENASFENCNMFNCNFENVELLHSNFEKARISDTDLKNVTFSEVNFSNASLNSSRWEETKFKDVDFINSTWKHISTMQNTVSFENCDFLLTDMNSVYIKGSQVIGEIKNAASIYVTMGGATEAEVKRHEQSIMETLNANKAKAVTKDKTLIGTELKKSNPQIDNVKPKQPKKAKSR